MTDKAKSAEEMAREIIEAFRQSYEPMSALESKIAAALRERDAEIDRLRGVIAAIFNRLPSSGDFSEPQVVSGMLRDIFDLALNGLGSDSPAAKCRLGVEHELARAKELIKKQKEHLDGRLERIGVYVTELAESRATVAVLSEAIEILTSNTRLALIPDPQAEKNIRAALNAVNSLSESARRYQEEHERMRIALQHIAGGCLDQCGRSQGFQDAMDEARAALDGSRRSEGEK